MRRPTPPHTFACSTIGPAQLGRVPLTHPRCRPEISPRLYTVTIRRAFVHHAGHTLCGSDSNRLVLPSHYRVGISPP